MEARYFSISALSVEEERVPCVSKMEFAGLGYLDPATHGEDLPEKTRVEAPLWLAKLLASKAAVETEYPQHYKEKFRDHLEAGPAAVNLRDQSPHYFTAGDALARLKRDSVLQKKLLIAFTGDRFLRIMDLAFNSQHEDVTEHLRTFTDVEQELFDAGFQATLNFAMWRARKAKNIKAAAMSKPDSKRQRK
jgi:hypothetical protein